MAPLARAGIAVAFALALTWLVPAIGLDSRDAERGGARARRLRHRHGGDCGARRCSRSSASCSSRTRSRSPRSSCPGGASVAIELGVALDLMLVALVAVVFHERIFAEFGTADSAALRTLRD